MSREVDYTQCKLSKKTQNGEMRQMSWIPSEFAKVGKVLKFRDEDTGEWDEGWIVEAAYSTRSWAEVNVASQLYKHQRKASDI
jgi:hypothetical protein